MYRFSLYLWKLWLPVLSLALGITYLVFIRKVGANPPNITVVLLSAIAFILSFPGALLSVKKLKRSIMDDQNIKSNSGDDTMSWDVNLNSVVNVLSTHLTEEDTIRVIGEEAGIAMKFVHLGGNAYLNWHELLKRALDENRVFETLDRSIGHTQNLDVINAIQAYKSI